MKSKSLFEEKIQRYIVKIYGLVHGVGYRPHIYNAAIEFEIKGWVNNCDGVVYIDLEGTPENIKAFLIKVIKNTPPLAQVKKVEVLKKESAAFTGFFIKESVYAKERYKFVLPDSGVCEKCITEIFDKNSSRYRYAFTNCTECGPRYSIIKEIPYDRKNTTMNNFKMCSECEEEYKTPVSRRFHTEPNCCALCGPRLILTDCLGEKVICLDEIKSVAQFIKEGKIVAVKGIGGFHLVCDAFNEAAVEQLRKRKDRPDKPLAVMAKDLGTARIFCEVGKKEEKILLSNKRPIVLLDKIKIQYLAENIAPGQNKIGVLLPYTPLQHLIFQEGLGVLVMTSGNRSGRPLEYKNEKAVENLKEIADYFLLHDREIQIPVDDAVVSVVKVDDELERVSRLGRGYAPYIQSSNIRNKIFACGSEMKNTFGFSQEGYIYISQYLGDLKEMESYKEYLHVVNHLKKLLDFKEESIAYDLHPYYMSTIFGKTQEGIKIGVQHHHAHLASCIVEHGLQGDVIGVIYDGIGMGQDGNSWGGEFFVGSSKKVQRVGQYQYVKIQGGDSAQKNIWKIAVSYLGALPEASRQQGMKWLGKWVGVEKEIVQSALQENLNCHYSSSVGRFFDCISSLLNIQQQVSYEGQGAIELENIAVKNTNGIYKYEIIYKDGMWCIQHVFILKEILEELYENIDRSVIAAKFQNTIVEITVDLVCKIRNSFQLQQVVLGGGVFENQYLLEQNYRSLKKEGFEVFFNERVPLNDSGISFGQIAVAEAYLEERGF